VHYARESVHIASTQATVRACLMPLMLFASSGAWLQDERLLYKTPAVQGARLPHATLKVSVQRMQLVTKDLSYQGNVYTGIDLQPQADAVDYGSHNATMVVFLSASKSLHHEGNSPA